MRVQESCPRRPDRDAGASSHHFADLCRQFGGGERLCHVVDLVGGFRYEGGQWTTQQLLTPSASSPATDQFGSIALNANGAVLISVPTWDGSTGVNISLFRYTPGQGWDTEIAAHYNSTTGSRCAVSWFESTEAVVVYADHTLPASLAAALYSNGAWGSAPAIPGNFPDVAAPKLAGAPSGEALLGVPYTAVYATFLRP